MISGYRRTFGKHSQIQVGRCLRPVDQLAPGKLLYRHDPVKKFELYR
ncbi:unnamed protein product [Nippostrongylus brasiliensis]|uniref:30S ribosomal protein S4 n=1 Tax=Nippostrongylus brasiliensis TaxID=27835 RepID=A0A0N4XUS0_NIPBR|nr:unnamed protein product [Nippostrongylus brasiliensis]